MGSRATPETDPHSDIAAVSNNGGRTGHESLQPSCIGPVSSASAQLCGFGLSGAAVPRPSAAPTATVDDNAARVAVGVCSACVSRAEAQLHVIRTAKSMRMVLCSSPWPQDALSRCLSQPPRRPRPRSMPKKSLVYDCRSSPPQSKLSAALAAASMRTQSRSGANGGNAAGRLGRCATRRHTRRRRPGARRKGSEECYLVRLMRTSNGESPGPRRPSRRLVGAAPSRLDRTCDRPAGPRPRYGSFRSRYGHG